MDGMVREAVGVFDAPENLDAAVAELEDTAFPRLDMSILGSDKHMKEKLGAHAARVEWMEDHPDVPRQTPIRREEKVIGSGALIGCSAYIAGCVGAILTKSGTHAFILFGITVGSILGAAIGVLGLYLLHSREKEQIERQMKHGGLLLWVRTADDERERLAQQILRKHGARDVHIHSIA